jgi:stearoyl-CoA desaturase (delta-9 desaturase)
VGTFLGVTIPFLGLLAAGFLLWDRGFWWTDLALLAGMYLLTLLGVTVGFHRFFTHRSFQTHKPIQFALGVCGSMAFQGRLAEWVGRHRCHHRASDAADDPHSPHQHGGGWRGTLRGLVHAHIGWAFAPTPRTLTRFARDILRDRTSRAVSALFPLWAVLGLLAPAAVGLALGGWPGALSGFIWGGLVRVFLVHHVTWSVNSVCHLWGGRPFPVPDESRNNALFGVLALGEGWHNNHHAFPSSARHGLRWWQVDVSYWLIRLLGACGLAWRIRVPDRAALDTAAASPARPA